MTAWLQFELGDGSLRMLTGFIEPPTPAAPFGDNTYLREDYAIITDLDGWNERANRQFTFEPAADGRSSYLTSVSTAERTIAATFQVQDPASDPPELFPERVYGFLEDVYLGSAPDALVAFKKVTAGRGADGGGAYEDMLVETITGYWTGLKKVQSGGSGLITITIANIDGQVAKSATPVGSVP